MPDRVRDALVALAATWTARAAALRQDGRARDAASLEQLAADVGQAIASTAPTGATGAPLTDDHLWTVEEAARYLGVSPRYLRDCACPRILLPGNGAHGQSLVRYDPASVKAWATNWRAGAPPTRAA